MSSESGTTTSARPVRRPVPGTSPGTLVTAGIGLAVGALVVAVSWNRSDLGDRERWWAIVATLFVAMMIATGLPRAQRLMPTPGVVPATLVVTLAAVYGCVPETDQIPLVAAPAIVLVITEVVLRRPLLLSWHGGVAALVLWAGVYGATGRQSALIGALFAWWAVLLVPLVADCWPKVATTAEPVRWMIALLGGAAAIVVARTGALEPTGGPAVAAVAIWGWASLALALVIAVVSSSRRVSARRAGRPG